MPMAIVRTAEWLLTTSAEEATVALRAGLEKLDTQVGQAENGRFTAESKRAMLKNRWAANWEVAVEPVKDGTLATVKVDMLGNKHYELLDELAEQLDEVLADRGLTAAIERLGKIGRTFGRKEVRRAQHMLHGDEQVLQLGQGKYGDKMGIVILTNRRLFFFEKSWGAQTVEEFPIKSISSVSVESKRGGEKLKIHASGNVSEITQMVHGHGDELARQLRKLIEDRDAPAAPSPVSAAPSVANRLKQLAELRESGILDEAEFAEKKAELLKEL
jgi:hypothetical protein